MIDVGANTGQSIDLFLTLNPNCEIFAFEPNPALFLRLKTKYAGNKNINLFQLGISDTIGYKTFHENIFHSTSSFEVVDLNTKYLKKKSKILGVKSEEIIKESYQVEVTTLADFISKHCNRPIDILKIDTEGHEYSCLNGLFTGEPINIKFIQLEVHNDDMYINSKSFKDITELLHKNGFEIAEKVNHGFGDFDETIFRNIAKKQ